ncbi:uncharacterized protein BJ171DRAFT_440489 [Polychytrium aggregatum]|uniref:uncharacterized protein n=1 Tax=Polychytrium aggregatum TaxID=110093 RepID=UPI0022FE1C7D|nr:uncharacterized protein BJ171DRAFT_440489 [Polychytrium aggregatum]KAI9206397.1 hypothetical protein BJ171DRAFT_440489 [Polychytrium aggregatum]
MVVIHTGDPRGFPRRKFELSPEQVTEIREAFSLFDSDGSGSISVKEWRIAMKALGFEPTREEMKRIMKEVDSDGSGTIEYKEFLELIERRMAEKSSRMEMTEVFGLFDGLREGKLSIHSLRQTVARLGEDFLDSELKEMIDEADRDADGEVTVDDFIRIMKKTNIW